MDGAEDFHTQFCHMMMSFEEEDEEFLRNILQQQPVAAGGSSSNNNNKRKNNHLSSSSISEDKLSFPALNFSTNISGNRGCGASIEHGKTGVMSSNKSYILSFDKSNVIPASTEAIPKHEESSTTPELCSTKRMRSSEICNNNVESRKKTRNCLESANHIMAERRRRQQLTERFIALSATIPGLKKVSFFSSVKTN